MKNGQFETYTQANERAHPDARECQGPFEIDATLHFALDSVN